MLLREHAGALEADFQRYYQVDLGGLWRGEFTPRRAARLASNLPTGARVWLSAEIDAAWTVGEHLAAQQVDLLAGANWQRGGKGDPPKPFPRPGDEQRKNSVQDQILSRAQQFQSTREVSS